MGNHKSNVFESIYKIYLGNVFLNTDEEFGERSVFVSLDGIQSELILIDHPSGEMSVSKRNAKKIRKDLNIKRF